MQKAYAAQAFGADYIANILHQQQIPRDIQTPLRWKHSELNELVTDPLSLPDYDALILESRKELPWTPLEQKLNQLGLTTMSQRLDPIVSDAAARNLSLVQALESLAGRTGGA